MLQCEIKDNDNLLGLIQSIAMQLGIMESPADLILECVTRKIESREKNYLFGIVNKLIAVVSGYKLPADEYLRSYQSEIRLVAYEYFEYKRTGKFVVLRETKVKEVNEHDWEVDKGGA